MQSFMDVEESSSNSQAGPGNTASVLSQVLGVHQDDSLFNNRSNSSMAGENNDPNVATGEGPGINPRAPAGGPTVGMKFPSLEAMVDFYQDHAKKHGFSITKRSCKKQSSEYDLITGRRLSCHKAGKPARYQTSKKVDCKAGIYATLCSDRTSWEVKSVTVEHNHDLEPRLSWLMAAHRKVTPALKRDLVAADTAGVRPCRSFRTMEIMNGGTENMGCLPRDCRNFINQHRRMRLKHGDAEELKKFFERMHSADGRFVYEMDLDNEGRLRNVMWIHPQAFLAYQQFNDVIALDSTYKVNQYNMPFVTFVGVNHHGHSILLGAGLLSHEDITTYRWLFRTWVRYMGGIVPGAILTDQCESMGAAIREEFPTTTHRLCIWHICSKVGSKFKGLRDRDALVKEFNNIVYMSFTVEEFEGRWAQFICDPRLRENQWLDNIYSIRSQWVPVYLTDTFWAGMRSTQRSESMHAFFDQFITSRTNLLTFVMQYEVALKTKLDKELKEEESSKNTRLFSVTGSQWEEQLRAGLTRNIYDMHRKQIQDSIGCNFVGFNVQDEVETFSVSDTGMGLNYAGTEYIMTVVYKRDGQYLDCTCKLFNTRGIICRHMILVVKYHQMPELNERYIMRRWRGDISRPHLWAYVPEGYPQMSDEFKRLHGLKGIFYKCAERAIQSDKLTRKLGLELVASFGKPNNDDPVPDDIHDVEDHRSDVPILDPRFLRSKGRPCLIRVRNNWNRRQRTYGTSRRGWGRSRAGDAGAGRGSGGVDASNGNGGVDASRGNAVWLTQPVAIVGLMHVEAIAQFDASVEKVMMMQLLSAQ